jgi:hypothetical protein
MCRPFKRRKQSSNRRSATMNRNGREGDTGRGERNLMLCRRWGERERDRDRETNRCGVLPRLLLLLLPQLGAIFVLLTKPLLSRPALKHPVNRNRHWSNYPDRNPSKSAGLSRLIPNRGMRGCPGGKHAIDQVGLAVNVALRRANPSSVISDAVAAPIGWLSVPLGKPASPLFCFDRLHRMFVVGSSSS